MSNRQNITLEDIERVGSLPLLGAVVTWRLMNIRVQEADLKAALEQAGYESHMPSLPSPRKALRRTLEAWIAERTRQRTGKVVATTEESTGEEENESNQRTLIRVINRPGAEHLVFGIVSEDVDFQSLGLTYGTSIRILLHKKTGQILCTTDARGVISAENESITLARELQPIWSQYRTLFFSEDLSRMVRSIIAGMRAISLRREGGVYFVPQSEQPQIEIMRGLLASLPTSGHEQPFLCALPVPDVEATKSQMARAVHYGFMDEIRAMGADLERFIDAKPGTVKSETIAERLQSYKDVKAKVGMYATLLSMQQSNIVKELDELTEKAKAIVLGKKQSGSSPGTSGGKKSAPSVKQAKTEAPPPKEKKAAGTDSSQEPEALPRVKEVKRTGAVMSAAAETEELTIVSPPPTAGVQRYETLRLFN
jgi:hypothetical protein